MEKGESYYPFKGNTTTPFKRGEYYYSLREECYYPFEWNACILCQSKTTILFKDSIIFFRGALRFFLGGTLLLTLFP